VSQRAALTGAAGPASPCDHRSASPHDRAADPDLSLRDATRQEAERLRAEDPSAAPQRRLLVLEPYNGGSHRAVLDCLLPALGWEFDLLELPARKWKWRMRGAAITFADEALRLDAEWRSQYPDGESGRPGARARWDAAFASTFLNLAEFKGLAGPAIASVPTVVYFHENQLVYPNRHTAEWDLQFPLTNITSALAADECWFNTAWNRGTFLEGIAPFISQFPDHRPKGLAERIAGVSRVLAPPFDPASFNAAPPARGPRCRVVWPHRWEHDKDPDAFFDAVTVLAREGLDFEVAVAGQEFAETGAGFAAAARALGDRIAHVGEPEGRDAYARLLAGCDVAVSTAANEFFGLAMVEAAYAGCYPLVPDRLAYPEIYPAEMRYGSPEALVARLRSLIVERPWAGQGRALAERFTIAALAPAYREAFENLVGH
jgi:glycosyltransferase involved in cell wall biosynthesis